MNIPLILNQFWYNLVHTYTIHSWTIIVLVMYSNVNFYSDSRKSEFWPFSHIFLKTVILLLYHKALRAKVYWNLLWNSPGWVPFGANLNHFRAKFDMFCCESDQMIILPPDKAFVTGTVTVHYVADVTVLYLHKLVRGANFLNKMEKTQKHRVGIVYLTCFAYDTEYNNLENKINHRQFFL